MILKVPLIYRLGLLLCLISSFLLLPRSHLSNIIKEGSHIIFCFFIITSFIITCIWKVLRYDFEAIQFFKKLLYLAVCPQILHILSPKIAVNFYHNHKLCKNLSATYKTNSFYKSKYTLLCFTPIADLSMETKLHKFNIKLPKIEICTLQFF